MLAEQSMASGAIIGDGLIEQLALQADPADFLRISEHVPRVRARLVQLHPALLDSPDLVKVRAADLVELLQSLPGDDGLVAKVIRRLLPTYNTEAASFFRSRFPDVLRCTVLAVVAQRGSFQEIAPTWTSAARISEPVELSYAIQQAAGSAAEVAACVLLADSDLGLAGQIPIHSVI